MESLSSFGKSSVKMRNFVKITKMCFMGTNGLLNYRHIENCQKQTRLTE